MRRSSTPLSRPLTPLPERKDAHVSPLYARAVFRRPAGTGTVRNRREFIGKSSAIIAASRLARYETLASQIGANKRVGIIGPGWYGKTDLLRLVQVAPVNVVSMCDVDSRMLNEAADLVATRQVSKQRPRLYSDWRTLLAEKDLDLVIIDPPDHWHALPTIEAA